jgi:GNAT superfamily N-acetyltransferase
MRIRDATDADLDIVGRVHARSRRTTYVGLVPDGALRALTGAGQTRYWRRRLAAEPPPYSMHVVEVEDRVVGFVMGGAEGETATLHAIHVLPAAQGSGAAGLLHETVLADFRTWGCTSAELWVLDGNERAQAFYRREGWTADGTRDAHVIGGAEVPILRYRRPVR